LTTVGPLGFDTTDQVGFDISGVEGPEPRHRVRLADGAGGRGVAALHGQPDHRRRHAVGDIGGGRTIRDLSVVPRFETIFAVAANNTLIAFRSDAPQVLLGSLPIAGLQLGETILGIDFRPATGQLYALGSSSRQYVVSTTTGVATAVGSGRSRRR
jgi:hypothetical protein